MYKIILNRKCQVLTFHALISFWSIFNPFWMSSAFASGAGPKCMNVVIKSLIHAPPSTPSNFTGAKNLSHFLPPLHEIKNQSPLNSKSLDLKSKDLLFHWDNLKNTKKYQPIHDERIGTELYLQKPGYFEFLPLINESQDPIIELWNNSFGGGLTYLDTNRTNSRVAVVDFDVLSNLFSQQKYVYKISGYHVRLKSSNQVRTVIHSITRVHPSYETSYYKKMAEIDQIKPITIQLKSKVDHHDSIFIDSRIIFKIEHKHQVPFLQIAKALQDGDFTVTKSLSEPNNPIYYFHTTINDSSVIILFRKDARNSQQLQLKTAYYF